MNELREQAMKHILRIEKLREQHAELEDLAAALIEPFADNSFPFGSDIEIGLWDAKGIKYRVCLEQDLGITSLTADFREILTAELEERKEVLETELKKLIGGNGDAANE